LPHNDRDKLQKLACRKFEGPMLSLKARWAAVCTVAEWSASAACWWQQQQQQQEQQQRYNSPETHVLNSQANQRCFKCNSEEILLMPE
jgi:hypothetical protein